MSVFGDASQIVVIVGGVGGWVVVAKNKWSSRRELKREAQTAVEQRTWHGYIDMSGVNAWPVRLLEIPDRSTARVVLEVLDNHGAPDGNWAENLRRHVEDDGLITRPPSEAQYQFLLDLQGERRREGGEPIW